MNEVLEIMRPKSKLIKFNRSLCSLSVVFANKFITKKDYDIDRLKGMLYIHTAPKTTVQF